MITIRLLKAAVVVVDRVPVGSVQHASFLGGHHGGVGHAQRHSLHDARAS